MYSRHSTDIVGYVYAADIYCADCIADALTSSPEYDGWGLAEGVRMTTEANLSEIAAHFGIDRDDESSFSSNDFPKVIFANQAHDGCGDTCGVCHEPIGFECGVAV